MILLQTLLRAGGRRGLDDPRVPDVMLPTGEATIPFRTEWGIPGCVLMTLNGTSVFGPSDLVEDLSGWWGALVHHLAGLAARSRGETAFQPGDGLPSLAITRAGPAVTCMTHRRDARTGLQTPVRAMAGFDELTRRSLDEGERFHTELARLDSAHAARHLRDASYFPDTRASLRLRPWSEDDRVAYLSVQG